MKSYHLQLLIIFMATTAAFADISFRKYCKNGTNPDPLPSIGKSSSGFLVMNDLDGSYDPGLNCTVILSAERGFQLFISFTLINLRNSSVDTLTVIYNDQRQKAVLSGQMKCTNESCRSLMFESGYESYNVTFEFVTANITVLEKFTGFKALYTVFDNADHKTGRCHGKNRFLCSNNHCISAELYCDGHNNCGDNSDELPCNVTLKETIWGVVVVAVAVVSTVIFVPLFCFLAVFGTKNVVRSVTLPNQATPLCSTINNDETSNLLSSSGTRFWGSNNSSSFNPHHSYSFDTSTQRIDSPSTSNSPQFKPYHGTENIHMPS